MSEGPVILLAETEEAIRESMEIVLTEEGYDCHVVDNIHSLLTALRIYQFRLSIIDIEIIDTNGQAILSTLQQCRGKRPSLLITLTYERIRDMLELIELGLDGHLLKPFQFEDLIKRVHQIIQSGPRNKY